MKSSNRKMGEQILRDFAAEDAKDMRHYAKELEDSPESTLSSGMYYYHRGRYNAYKHAMSIFNTEPFWRDE